MFTGIWFSCLHYTESPPIMRKDGYGVQILDKLDFILKTADNQNAHVFCNGDLFHLKTNTSMRELNRLASVLKGHKPIHMILGNHDIQGYNQNIETQPVGVLEKSGLVEILPNGEHWEFDEGVFVSGANYCAHYEETEPYSGYIDREDVGTHIRMTHGMLTNRQLPFEATNVRDIELNCDILVNGHWHQYWDDQELGVYNIGSVARVAMEKNEINKTPLALIIEVKGNKRSIRPLDIPVKKDVWRSEIKRDTLNVEEVEAFAKEIENLDITNDEDILNKLLEGESEEVTKLVFEYLGD